MGVHPEGLAIGLENRLLAKRPTSSRFLGTRYVKCKLSRRDNSPLKIPRCATISRGGCLRAFRCRPMPYRSVAADSSYTSDFCPSRLVDYSTPNSPPAICTSWARPYKQLVSAFQFAQGAVGPRQYPGLPRCVRFPSTLSRMRGGLRSFCPRRSPTSARNK